MPDIHYKRLTRSGSQRGFAVAFRSRGSLWLGPDHLLSVETNGYTETYKRFYFRDIQAIIVRQTKLRSIMNGILVAPLVGCLIGLILTLFSRPLDEVGVLICLILSAVFLLLLLINSMLGAGCVCYLRTAVQIEVLPSLYRVPKMRRIFNEIQPLIAAVQGGEFSSEAAAAQMAAWTASIAGAAPMRPSEPVVEEPNTPPKLES
jgi:hypothetical protein